MKTNISACQDAISVQSGRSKVRGGSSIRLLSIVLALIMVLGLVGARPFAASAETSGNYEYTVADGEATITGYSYTTDEELYVTIPSTLGGYPVTTIGFRAFYEDDSHLIEIIIPNGVTSIGDQAFERCVALSNVTIPDSVISIGTSAFFYCSSLTDVTIPGSVASIGVGAFAYCSSLTNVTIPGSVTSIGEQVFTNCTNLTDINVAPDNENFSSADGVLYNGATLLCYPEAKVGAFSIPNDVTAIANLAFFGCQSLTGITIPNSVTSIGQLAFARCQSLTDVTIPGSVINIEAGTFGACQSLTNVTILDGVTSIGYIAFSDCLSLATIMIPGSVTSIVAMAFFNCNSLIILCYENTYAQQYAIDNGNSYAVLQEPEDPDEPEDNKEPEAPKKKSFCDILLELFTRILELVTKQFFWAS